MQKEAAGTITIEVANAGNTDLKYLELTLLDSEDYKLITTRNYFYLGNLASDDTQSEDINIFINDDADIAHIPIQLKYSDANNQNFQQTFDLEIETYSSGEMKKFGLVQRSSGGIYIFIILLIIGGIFGYRYYKKKNSNKNPKR
jgi:uncharacterized membrane protein